MGIVQTDIEWHTINLLCYIMLFLVFSILWCIYVDHRLEQEGVSVSGTDLITPLQDLEVTYITRIFPNPIPSLPKFD